MNRVSPFKLGITGTLGSGKSAVGNYLKQHGFLVLDTDHVVRDLYQSNSELIGALVEQFGPAIQAQDGSIDRSRLREKVFGDATALATLEALVHPCVRAVTKGFLNQPDRPEPRAVLVPLLFESGSAPLYDAVWCVTVSEDTLLQRIQAREGISEAEARHRLSKQWSQAQKAERADWVIDNSGTLAELHQQLDNQLRHLSLGSPHA